MTTYKCPSCDHEGDLDEYFCLNCRKKRVMKLKDGSYPFACGNCDITWQFLTCPKCRASITKKFVDDYSWVWPLIIIGIALFFIFK